MSTKKALTKKLHRVRDANAAVRLVRRLAGTTPLEGFIVGVGTRWVLLYSVWEGSPNGWHLILRADIKRIDRRQSQRFSRRSLKLQGLWPPTAPPCQFNLSGTPKSLIETAAIAFPLVTIFTEGAYPDECYIGRPIAWSRTKLKWHDVKPSGRWAAETRKYRIADITQVSVGGTYEGNLNAVAGPPPDLSR